MQISLRLEGGKQGISGAMERSAEGIAYDLEDVSVMRFEG
jgi:hypothetical protein